MAKITTTSTQTKYSLDKNGRFIIENYNHAKSFSNFFPGIAGLWGIPMWVFYVNRGQCITSFGIESKDKAILEFQPANKAYRLTSLQGFRTLIKVKSGSKIIYWEPFQANIKGTDFKSKQTLSQSSHDLTLEEENTDLGLTATVNYFTLAEEPYAALVRQVTLKNTGKKPYDVQLIDGLPMIVPYGLTDSIMKNMSRTAEAWVKVKGIEERTPYYQLNVEISDTPEVTHIQEGNFFLSFNPAAKKDKLLPAIVDAAHVFGESLDFSAPIKFLNKDFTVPQEQQTNNRTPAAMSFCKFVLKPKGEQTVVSLFGYAKSEEQLKGIAKQATTDKFIKNKAKRNEELITEIKNFTLTKSSSREFNFYSSHTFLDNILRGGLPISVKTDEGDVALNVYSRKHGDLERDYNHFVVAPTYYSQGNGNYRDVNQNRRNDVWFNIDVRDSHLVNFLNLIQADGYNPLITKGASFVVDKPEQLEAILKRYLSAEDVGPVNKFLKDYFLLGELLRFIEKHAINIKGDPKEFVGEVIEICHKQELAEHGEGFWSDHWTYNLDLIESYFNLYPEQLNDLLLEKKIFSFYLNTHYVLPREHRYILNHRGVRQYKSVSKDEHAQKNGNKLRIKDGEGAVYYTNLISKILCLIANKAATLDPSGIGIEMEADKPNWYDALNGLPGLIGSSICETFELKRLSLFLLESLKQLSLAEDSSISLFEELATFVSGLTNVLSVENDNYAYWMKANDIKEHYRQRVQKGINGEEWELKVSAIRNFLGLVIAKTDQAIEQARNSEGFLPTYFYHEVQEYKVLDHMANETTYVRPLQFKRHDLPLFLEGYVHALRTSLSKEEAKEYYEQVRKSDLFDQKLKMYKVNTDLSNETEEIGRSRIFPRGWLENESVWLHMEYKFMLELLRSQLYDEFYENFRHVLVPFLNPQQYGRSILENSSFIVSSVHKDEGIHGQGFVARLSGSTAEFLHIWLFMNVGLKPFELDVKKQLVLNLKPILLGDLFIKAKTTCTYRTHQQQEIKAELPANTYSFNLFGAILVVYHNPKRKNTFGDGQAIIKEIRLTYPQRKRPVVISSPSILTPHAEDVRDRKVERIDVYFE